MDTKRSHAKIVDHRHVWTTGIAAALVTIALGVAGSQFHRPHGWLPHSEPLSWLAVVLMLFTGSYAVNRLSDGIGSLISRRRYPAAGAIVSLVATGVGYVIVLFSMFGVLGVSPQHLLIGASVTGVLVGIAAQQSMANVFASLVLLFARPFNVGDHIRVRSGPIGNFDADVLGIGLTYVTLKTDEGVLMVPNSAMLAAGIGQRGRRGRRVSVFGLVPAPTQESPASSETTTPSGPATIPGDPNDPDKGLL
jgi:small-conductance mechanosensitive channel